jgi:hypothetical protein
MVSISNLNAQRGAYVKKGSLEPVGVCDYSGFWFSRSDLVKQMEYRGNSLVWTGFMVGRPFLDVPSEQNRPPLIKNDPIAVDNAKPNEIGQDISSVSADERLRKAQGL